MRLIKTLSYVYVVLLVLLIPIMVLACKAKRTVDESVEIIDSLTNSYPQIDVTTVDTNYVNLVRFAGKIFPIAKSQDMSGYNGEYFIFGPITTPTQDISKNSKCTITKSNKDIPKLEVSLTLENKFGDSLTNVSITPILLMENLETDNVIFKQANKSDFDIVENNEIFDINLSTLLDFGYSVSDNKNYLIYLGELDKYLESFIVFRIVATYGNEEFNEDFYYSLEPYIRKFINK